jgi:hypothetical protein
VHAVHDEPDLLAILHETRGAEFFRSGVVDLPPAHKVRAQAAGDLRWRAALLG